MNALKGSITCAAKLLSPKFYAEKYGIILSNTRKSLHAGSPAPLFKAMLLVGVVGYTMEYSMVGSKLFFIEILWMEIYLFKQYLSTLIFLPLHDFNYFYFIIKFRTPRC